MTGMHRMGRGAGVGGIVAVVWVLSATHAVAEVPPEGIDDLVRAGKWTEIAALWRAEVDRDPGSLSAWQGYLRALATGGFEERLDAEAARAVAAFPSWTEPPVLRARALAAMGRPGEAAELLAPVSERSFLAAAERGEVLRELGRRDEAAGVFRGLLRAYDPARAYRAEDLFAFGTAARAEGDYQGAARLFELAYRDSLDYLPARLALARLFRQKHQNELAVGEVNDARNLAPYHPDVTLAQAELALLAKQLPNAEALANLVLLRRPSDVGARKILAQLDCVAERGDLVRTRMEEVLARNPYDREARTLLAAAAYLEGDSTAYHARVGELLAVDPQHTGTFALLGDILELLLRNPEATAMYRRVLASDPKDAVAWAALGHIAMREGREAEAREYLERGFELDKYNIRAYNQLELLDYMERFATYDENRYQFRLLAAEDSLLIPLLRERMERIARDLDERHGWSPPNPTVVEIFPDHEWFSARVTGLAWLEGIPGVCFGDVIAMDSPRTLSGRVNWEQILRHEYGHVLALGMTNRQVPFWFTEGLSVHLETHPRARNWDEILVGAWWDGGLVGVDSLTIAFTRPRGRYQRLLAYHQAGLIIDDVVARFGWDAVPRLLRAFGDGRSLQEAVPDVLGESYETFRERGLAVARARAEVSPLWPVPDPERPERILAAISAHPDDVRLRERLAVAYAQVGLFDDALRAAEELEDRDRGNAVAAGIRGLAARGADRPVEAVEHLAEAVGKGVRDLPFHLALAELTLSEGDTARAIGRFRKAVEVYPHSSEALLRLARLTLAQGDSAAAIGHYRELLAADDGAAPAAVELARLELAVRDGAGAHQTLEFARGVLPLDPDVLALEGQALLLLDRPRDAYDRLSLARRIDLRNVESMVGMARYYFRIEDFEEAEYFAGLALKYDPGNVGAAEVLRAAQTAW